MHTLTGHTSLVGLLGLSPSHLVSAAADSTLRVWDPDTGQLQHALASHIGAITCFIHDEFKVLSGSDGGLKMWDIRDGTFVRDLLSNVTGVWQVVSEGRWCVAASNRVDSTIIDIWDFGKDANGRDLLSDTEWIGEPPFGDYDDSSDEEEDEDDQADADAMDQDLEVIASDPDPEMNDQSDASHGQLNEEGNRELAWQTPETSRTQEHSDRLHWAPLGMERAADISARDDTSSDVNEAGPSNHFRNIPGNEETPTRPRMRVLAPRRR